MSICSKCGAEIADGTAFCPSCGAGQVQQNCTAEPVDKSKEVPAVSAPQELEAVRPTPVYQPQPWQNPEASATLSGPAKIFSIISMACGLLSLVTSYGGFMPAVAALVFSGIATKKAPGVRNIMAKVGKITGIIGIVLSVIWLVIAVAGWISLLVNLGTDTGYYY